MYPFVKENLEIKREIGSGGTAAVYLAWDRWAKKNVAIKALFKTRYEDKIIREKFKQEANLYLYLDHPNIADLTDYIVTPQTDYIVMEYIEGLNLEQFIQTKSGPIADENLFKIFAQVLHGVAYAHHNNVTHLDIKPSNIMITNNLTVKVLDFGISSSKDEKIESAKRRMGTPMYMSPEQIDMQNVGRQSDIYSLGVTLHHMVTGQLPYKSGSIKEIFHKIKFEKLPKIVDIYPHANPKLQAVIDAATEKDLQKRYKTCEEFEYFLSKSI
jgi:serine/threonine-protein kinase